MSFLKLYVMLYATLFIGPGKGLSRTLSVCPGGQLTLECNANSESLLSWIITFQNNYGIQTRYVSSTGPAENQAALTVNGTVFYFLRSSISPLMSTMLIESIAVNFGGTRIDCSFGGRTITSIIHVIGNGTSIQRPIVAVNSELKQVGKESITVIFQWFQESNVLYDVDIVPPVALRFTESASVELILFYNVNYNFSITATLCGQNNTYDTQLHYARCIDPFNLLSDEYLKTTQYNDPILVGSVVGYSCNDSFGLVLTGPNVTVCTESGQWEPDPRDIQCIADCKAPMVNNSTISTQYTSTLKDSILKFKCKGRYVPIEVVTAICFYNGTWIPNPADHTCTTTSAVMTSTNFIIIVSVTTVAALCLTSIICLIVGLFCSHCCCEKKRSKGAKSENSAIPVYDIVLPKSTSEDLIQNLKLKENVVYAWPK